jgi:hypothetical protein
MKGATDQHLGHPTVQLRRVRPEKNERRFYAMTAALDLFGEGILIRNWGELAEVAGYAGICALTSTPQAKP